MSPSHDAESPQRPRPRSSTTSFPSFAWTRRKPEPIAPSPSTSSTNAPDVKSVDALIALFTPASVPSLATARQLVQALKAAETPTSAAGINGILSILCRSDVPALRAVGFDALSAYLENANTPSLSDLDRFVFFSLFPTTTPYEWNFDVWDSAHKALVSLTQKGLEIVGIESNILALLKSWVDGAFSGLLSRDNVAPNDRAERERSVTEVCDFLSRTMSAPKNVARLNENDITSVLQFLGQLVERTLLLPQDLFGSVSPPSDPQSPQTPTRVAHRRHYSSTSVPQASTPVSSSPRLRRPADVAVSVYVAHLTAQMRFLSPPHLHLMLPILFRALAYYASPLTRLSLTDHIEFEAEHSLESRIVGVLDPLLNGAYASTCFVIMKRHTLPQQGADVRVAVQMSTGACRALRIYWRRALYARLARAVVARSNVDNYTSSGAPGALDLNPNIMARAWDKDEITRGDSSKVGRLFRRAAEAWISSSNDLFASGDLALREEVLLEIAGAVRDVFEEYNQRDDFDDIDEEESEVVGGILSSLSSFVTCARNGDGSPFIIPIPQYLNAPTPFLRLLTKLLSRNHHMTPIVPPLTLILLNISDHLADVDTEKVISTMYNRGDFSPMSIDWISNWNAVLSKPNLTSLARPLTRNALVNAMQNVFAFIRDVPVHRHPFSDCLLKSCRSLNLERGSQEGYDVIWHILADEMILRMMEAQESAPETREDVIHESLKQKDVKDGAQDHAPETVQNGQVQEESTTVSIKFVDDVLDVLSSIARDSEDEELDTVTIFSLPPTVSPVLSRGQSEVQPTKEKESGLLSLLSSLASGSGTSSRPPAAPAPSSDEATLASDPATVDPVMPAASSAVVALIHIFSQLAFTPFALSEQSLFIAVRIYKIFVDLLATAKSSRARLSVLQFFFRLRVDRDHRLYSVYKRYDRLGHITALAGTIGRTEVPVSASKTDATTSVEDDSSTPSAIVRARVFQRDGRRVSRGRERPDRSASSRSRSRAAHKVTSPTDALPTPVLENVVIRKALWSVPEVLPFNIPESDTPSDGLMSYDPDVPDNIMVLPTADMLNAFIDIIRNEKDWEILSYVLCHLPTLLSNKHLFCGPFSRVAICSLLETLCSRIASGELGKLVTHWPPGLRPRDAQGLAFHTLSVLISYRAYFDAQRRHVLVEMLMTGLSWQQSTTKACIQALSISAFELPSSVKRFLPDILTKLSQIMTNVSIATYIIDFLAIVGSLPHLYANFIERDYKVVFGVTLQYLRLHNRPDSPESQSVLSQHVRLMSYCIIYVWLLSLKLKDRPQHVKYIVRQLLLANEGRSEVDEPTEVCFDWLARYTYGSGDPRPASSMLSEIIMRPASETVKSDVVSEKSWLVGNALITIRALSKLGWVEVNARRPSGLTRFLARVENVPMVGPGEVDPDTVSVPATLAMDREPDEEDDALYQEVIKTLFRPLSDDPEVDESLPRPDPITGYVWKGTAPSQRRKEVSIDPSFFALQLSPFSGPRQSMKIEDVSLLPSFLRTLDRMPVIDTHKVGILYVAPNQTHEKDILGNVHGSPAYTRFLEGLGRLINLRGQKDVYAGGLDPEEDGEYAYAWWDDTCQVLYHTATLMPNHEHDPLFSAKKRHIGNDYVRIVWNDSGAPYRFDTLATEFQFCNIVIEPHSVGAIAAFSNSQHANEYFRVVTQGAPGMRDFAPLGDFKLISAESLPLLVRQLSLLADWYSSVFQHVSSAPGQDAETNWRARLRALKRFRTQLEAARAKRAAESGAEAAEPAPAEGIPINDYARDFTSFY